MPHESERFFSSPSSAILRFLGEERKILTYFLYWLCKMFMLMFTSPKTSVLFEFTESYIN